MTIASDYIGLQKQIADELGDRQDLLSPLSDSGITASPIQNAIQSAVAMWEREQFYFNQVYTQDAFTLVVGQEFYTSADYAPLATLAEIKKLRVKISNQRYYLRPRTWEYVEDISVNPQTTANPTDYAYFAETLRFYPIPDGAYPITISGVARGASLQSADDANYWTEDAFDLIRSTAKLILAQEVLHDSDLATECKIAIYGDPSLPQSRSYLMALNAETGRRTAKGRVRPTYF